MIIKWKSPFPIHLYIEEHQIGRFKIRSGERAIIATRYVDLDIDIIQVKGPTQFLVDNAFYLNEIDQLVDTMYRIGIGLVYIIRREKSPLVGVFMVLPKY